MDAVTLSTPTLFAAALVGVAVGTASGLTPGVHVNTLALLLAATAPAVDAPALAVGVAILSAGVVHSFLDVVPALTLGVPDAAMAPTALPGHQLVLAGRGREALRISAVGSGLAVAAALPLAVPVTWLMTRAYPTLRSHLPLVLALVVVALLATEPSWLRRWWGLVAFALSGAFGAVALGLPTGGLVAAGNVLAPIFAGLFGVPVLLDALGGGGVPPQGDARVTMARRRLGESALAGSLAGAAVGYLPGVSAAVAAVLALPVVEAGGKSEAEAPDDPGSEHGDPRAFLAASSGANTSNAVFALLALVALGVPRTGVMVALEQSGSPLSVAPLGVAVAVGAAAGFVLVLACGDRYLAAVGRVDTDLLSLSVVGVLAALSWVFAGATGVAVLAIGTLVGLVPVRFGTRRVYLMGVLIAPLALGV